MKQSHKLAAGVIASLGLGIAVATAYANPGQMGAGMGPQGGMQHGAQGNAQHGTKGGMQHGAQADAQHGRKGGQRGMHGARGASAGHGAGHGAGAQMMAPEERTALQEKMRNATPEERQQIAAATRAEMQKRAQEQGITLPEGRGPRTGAATQAPATTEQAD
ncbi:MAG TPA: hypothetical protein VMN03_08565 [Burkholderiales bacterium]|nr:hypothetical protein [Burkholderiales bacterium]